MVLRAVSGNCPGRFGARTVYTGSSGTSTQGLRYASATNQYANSASTFNLGTGAAQTDYLQRAVHTIGQDVNSLVIGITMQWIKAATGISDVGNSMTIMEMAITYNGTFVAVTSGGATSWTINNTSNWLSDPILSTTLAGASKFTKGTQIGVRFRLRTNSPTTDKFPIGRGSIGDQAIYLDPAKTTVTTGVYSTAVLAYSMTNGGVNGTDAKFANNPVSVFVLGYHTNPSFLMLGDSKTYGTGDTNTAVGDVGMTRQLYSDPTNAATVVCSGLNMGCPSGFSMEVFTATASGIVANHEFWYQFGNYAVIGYGTNNMSQPNQTTLYTRLRAKGINFLIQRSLTPRTTSTDSWATTANQTLAAGWGAGQSADTFEIFLKGNTATDANFAYYQSQGERAATSGTNYWLWAVNGSANFSENNDGLHENAVGYELNIGTAGTITTQAGGTVATSLRAYIATLP